MPSSLYVFDAPAQAWRARGRADVPITVNEERFSDANQPWKLRAGESYTDNMPAGVPIVKANELTSSDDIYDVLQAANSLSSGSYIELDPQAYYINSFRNYGGMITGGGRTRAAR